MPDTGTQADLRFPIGRSRPPASAAEHPALIEQIAAAPAALREAVRELSDAQLDTPYREGGWTVRQGVHHLPESHMNAYVRFKLALTEDTPVIKPYDEAAWAALPDTGGDVDPSLRLLDALHERWVATLRAMREDDFTRAYMHPENGLTPLSTALGIYAWHGRHHVAHVTTLRARQGW